MRQRSRGVLAIVTALCAALLGAVSPASAMGCGDLASLALDGARVDEAELTPAGPITVYDAAGAQSAVQAPAYCRVQGVAAGSVGYEVWLPAQGWNGRLLSVGNGGFGGKLPVTAMADGLAAGYAVTADDTGHQGEDRAWMRDPAKVRLWGHSAVHLATAPAKAITAAYYGKPAAYAYFSGCSTGGAEAMEEAEFFPEDFDGVVAGAPGMSYTHLMLSFLWGLKATDRPGALLTPDKLQLLHRAVLDACDAGDGVRDGLVSNPLACRFDPAVLTCKDADGPQCLTAAQVQTAKLIYQGPRNPRTGAQIYPGFALGSEADAAAAGASPFNYGWNGIQGPLAKLFAIPLLRDMVYQDPAWDWRRFDWDKDVAELDRRISADITATSADLSGFAKRGGKLIMYQGWGDQLNGQTLPIDYRRQVTARLGARRTEGVVKLYMAPGVGHCGGGPGPDHFDMLTALRTWVETGAAPAGIVATVGTALPAGLSRLLCPYPQTAKWDGRGDANTSAAFICMAPTLAR
ncbi:MAG: tannase/feruloyl esterase family alpha/beta hydrolase [Caulobacteraceae bacterium]